MPGLKTNEREGVRAVLRHSRMSAYKAREVLDLIRGVEYDRATEILASADRGAAKVVGKVLRSAAANAEHNEQLEPDELYVSACYADEGATLKRWRPRARGRATRIRKRTCHITVILSRLPEDEIARRRARVAAEQAARRQRRVAGARRGRAEAESVAEIAAADAEAQQEAVEAATEAALGAASSEDVEAEDGAEPGAEDGAELEAEDAAEPEAEDHEPDALDEQAEEAEEPEAAYEEAEEPEALDEQAEEPEAADATQDEERE